jgi:hypothetical protein
VVKFFSTLVLVFLGEGEEIGDLGWSIDGLANWGPVELIARDAGSSSMVKVGLAVRCGRKRSFALAAGGVPARSERETRDCYGNSYED